MKRCFNWSRKFGIFTLINKSQNYCVRIKSSRLRETKIYLFQNKFLCTSAFFF